MATPAETLAALQAARLSIITGKTARVSIGGVTREFLSLKDIQEAIDIQAAEIAAAEPNYSTRAQARFV